MAPAPAGADTITVEADNWACSAITSWCRNWRAAQEQVEQDRAVHDQIGYQLADLPQRPGGVPDRAGAPTPPQGARSLPAHPAHPLLSPPSHRCCQPAQSSRCRTRACSPAAGKSPCASAMPRWSWQGGAPAGPARTLPPHPDADPADAVAWQGLGGGPDHSTTPAPGAGHHSKPVRSRSRPSHPTAGPRPRRGASPSRDWPRPRRRRDGRAPVAASPPAPAPADAQRPARIRSS